MDAVLARDRLQAGERLEARLARNLVTRDGLGLLRALALVVEHGHLQRHDLRVEPSFLDRARRAELRLEPEPVAVGARDAVLRRDALGALELARELEVLAVLPRDRLTEAGLRAGDRIGT